MDSIINSNNNKNIVNSNDEKDFDNNNIDNSDPPSYHNPQKNVFK